MLEPLDILNEVTTRLPYHELLLSFQNDSGVVKFEDWWHQTGKESFEDYCKENSHIYGE